MTTNYPVLTDGVLCIDNSGLSCIKTCATLARYTLLDKRERAGGVAKGRGPGKAWHLAMETRYKRVGGEAPAAAIVQAMQDAVAKGYDGLEQVEGDDYLTLARLQEVARIYNEGVEYVMGKDGKNGRYSFPGYGREPWEVLGTEVPFAVHLGSVDSTPVIYIGRSDLVVRSREREEVLVVDHKTMRQWGPGKLIEWRMAAGPKGYAHCIPQYCREGIEHLPWAVRQELGQFEGRRLAMAKQIERVHGFQLNAIVMRDINDLSRAKNPPNEFHRETFYYMPHVLEEWRADALAWCKVWLEMCARGEWTMNDRACSYHFGRACPYYEVCSLEPGKQREIMLATDVFQPANWSPLTRLDEES